MLELLSLFGISSVAALTAGLWGETSEGDTDPPVAEAEDPAAPVDLSEGFADALISDLPQITGYDSDDEMLLVGVEPDYAGAGQVTITEASDRAGTAVISLDGTAVAEVPGAYGSLMLDGIELVELDNFA
jgi:hypothetical protein